MLPPAPGLFSTTTDWFQVSESFCASWRATTSVVPPAAKGTMIFTGFEGHACAAAIAGTRARIAAARRLHVRIFIRFLLGVFRSVSSSISLSSEGEREPGEERECGGERRKRLLPVPPRQQLEREQPQPPGEMGRKEDNEDPLAGDDKRLLGPAQLGVEGRLALQGAAEHPEVGRQE